MTDKDDDSNSAATVGTGSKLTNSKSSSKSARPARKASSGSARSGNSNSNNSNKGSARRMASGTRRQRDTGRRNVPVPPWATTVASLVGVGVALGFGLFATRARWMPYAEDLNERLHDQWDERGQNADSDADDDYSDFDAADADDWASASGTTSTTPGSTTGINASSTTGV